MCQLHPHLLLIMFHVFNAFALNLPNTTVTSLSAFDERFCWPKRSMFSKAPKFKDCDHAINQLPQLEGFNPFHNGDPDDPFKLPMERTSRTCTVCVELRGSSKVASSWAQIVTSTLILNIKCFYRLMRSQAGSVEFAGGIRADITGRRFATLEYADVLDREGNLTSA